MSGWGVWASCANAKARARPQAVGGRALEGAASEGRLVCDHEAVPSLCQPRARAGSRPKRASRGRGRRRPSLLTGAYSRDGCVSARRDARDRRNKLNCRNALSRDFYETAPLRPPEETRGGEPPRACRDRWTLCLFTCPPFHPANRRPLTPWAASLTWRLRRSRRARDRRCLISLQRSQPRSAGADCGSCSAMHCRDSAWSGQSNPYEQPHPYAVVATV